MAAPSVVATGVVVTVSVLDSVLVVDDSCTTVVVSALSVVASEMMGLVSLFTDDG